MRPAVCATYFLHEAPYQDLPTNDPCRRPIEWVRTLYRADDLSGVAPLGALEARGLPGESYRLAFTPGRSPKFFQRPQARPARRAATAQPARVLGGQAGNHGGYLQGLILKADGRFPPTTPTIIGGFPRAYLSSANPGRPRCYRTGTGAGALFMSRRDRDLFGLTLSSTSTPITC